MLRGRGTSGWWWMWRRRRRSERGLTRIGRNWRGRGVEDPASAPLLLGVHFRLAALCLRGAYLTRLREFVRTLVLTMVRVSDIFQVRVADAGGSAIPLKTICMEATMPRRNGASKSKGVNTSGDKAKALELAIGQIDRHFGQGAVMRLGDAILDSVSGAISTGSISLDVALGVGGVPRGRVVEVYGAESSGKTTLAYHVMANAQAEGGTAAYIDAEHALDPAYAAKCGVDIEELLVSQPDTAEQGLEICEYLVRSGAVDIVVVDSVAALVPRAELEGDMGDTHVGLQARLMSQALRKLTSAISRSNTCVIFINQLREKVGVFFGNPEVTPGGRALKFYSSVRVDLRRLESIKQGSDVLGNRVRARIVKNKVAPPFRVAEFDIMYSEGISRYGELLDIGVDEDIIRKSGSFYSFGDIRLGQGRENSKQFLSENDGISSEIEELVRSKLSPQIVIDDDDEVESEDDVPLTVIGD